MRQVDYAGGSFVTSDSIASVLLEYAASLANAARAATINVPAVGDSGEFVDVQILIGPSSQLLSRAIVHQSQDPAGADFIAAISERMTILRRTFIPSDGEASIWGI